MKIITSCLAAILFSTLFYGQNIGINLSIFSLATISILAIQHPKIIRLKSAIFYSSVYLLTAIAVIFNHTALTIFANCVAFFTVIGTFSESRSSIYVRWLNGVYTVIAAFFQRKFEASNSEEQRSWQKDIDLLHTTKLIGIPLVILVVFALLYKNGNPIFNDLIGKINFDFINFQWLLFTVLGFFLFNNIISPVNVNPATKTDLNTDNQLHPSEPLIPEQLKKEQQLGVLLMALLNILLIFYSMTEVYYLFTNDVTSASALSIQVHSGVNALIASIVIAIVIILYFFRGSLNFYEHNTLIKKLSYAWILLNIILVILIAIKNNNYVAIFGFTYKRIGVFIYLTLTLVGLVTTFLKVHKIKNLWFLFRVNAQVAFAVLIISSCIDWDYSITNYNLKHAKSLDLNYLIRLTDNNAILLQEYALTHPVTIKQGLRIQRKHENFLNAVSQRTWQEWTYDNIEIPKHYDR